MPGFPRPFFNSYVSAFATLPNGDIIAAGNFTTAGGIPASRIAQRNGTAWFALGSGMSGVPAPAIYALTVLPNGDVVAGGGFQFAGGVNASRIARWNGTSWAALGTGTSSDVRALATLPNGDLVAGGGFTTAGGVSANYVARWNGTTWSGLGTGMSGGGIPVVNALTVLHNGDVVAAGGFLNAGGVTVNRVARWDGNAWHALGSGLNDSVSALVTLPNGDLVAGGNFTSAGGGPAHSIARWNGATWSPLGTGMPGGIVFALATLPNGNLVAGGEFATAGGVTVNRIARYDGTNWFAFGSGTDNWVRALVTLHNGDLAVGGFFTTAGGQASAHFAVYDYVSPPCCDSIDFNNDGLFPDTQDIDDFLSVFGGGPCSNDPNCNDIDFNNDGLFPDTLDIDSLLSVFGGGDCL
jgi:trimeric autotransporter adhesin